MYNRYRHILIIADLEGSSGCWSEQASKFLTDRWCRACVAMSRDVDGAVRALFDAGVKAVTVKDFHRTGYNLFAELIDPRASILSGYRLGPIAGIGNPDNAQAVMFLGMHAASGSGGFLAHTLTSRIARLEVNGRLLAEVELFAASLAPFGIRPIFFSGCAVACEQARTVIENIQCYPIDKSRGLKNFDADSWRTGLAQAAVNALSNDRAAPYAPVGPLDAWVTLRDGDAAAGKLARRWNFEHQGARVHMRAADMNALYLQLIKLCYLTPLVEKWPSLALGMFNLRGRIGLWRARRRLKRWGRFG